MPACDEFARRMKQYLEGQPFEWHPLGFAKLTVTKGFDGDGSSLQVHLWTSSSKLEMPHSHSNALRSHVVVGSIGLKKWHFDEDDAGKSSLFEINHGYGGTREYVFSKRGNSRVWESSFVDAGHSYRIEPGELHTSALSACSACTIVIRSGSKKILSTCVDPDQNLIGGKYLSRTLRPEERTLLEEII